MKKIILKIIKWIVIIYLIPVMIIIGFALAYLGKEGRKEFSKKLKKDGLDFIAFQKAIND